MITLWQWVTGRHLLHEGGRTLLTLFGVALGVAVLVSIRLANHSALASFSETVDSVAGRANLQVTSDSGGFDAALLDQIRAVPGVHAAAPVVQVYALARLPGPGLGIRSGRSAQDRDRQAGTPAAGAPEAAAYQETLLVLGVDLAAEAPFGRYRPQGLGAGALQGSGQGSGVTDAQSALAFVFDPTAVAITRSLADRHRLRTGDSLRILSAGQPVALTVRQILESKELEQAMGGNVVITTLATAQAAFHRAGKLDRLDLIVAPERWEAVRDRIAALLPAHAVVGRAEARTQQVENLLSAFELSLTALSFIALFVAMFLIFNAVSMSALRRRRETGILRSVGVTRRQVVLQFLSEGLALGILGSLAGLRLGTAMAKVALGAIERTITELYLVTYARDLRLEPTIYLAGFALGVAAALLSALAPALEAAGTPPSATVSQGMFIEAQGVPVGRWTIIGLGLLAATVAVAYWTVAQRRAHAGFLSAGLLLAGFSLLAPGFTLLCEGVLATVVGRLTGIEGALGIRYLRDAVARTSVVVAALMVSVGMMVALSVMVGSFRQTVSLWVNQTLRGDLYVEPLGRRVTGSATVLPPEVVKAARNLPGVAAVDTYRALRITYGGRIAFVVAIDFEVQRRFGRLEFMEGPATAVLGRALADDGVVVTESFAFRHRVRPGDRLTLQTPTGEHGLPVAGVFYDYSTEAGAILMDRQLYRRLWRDDRTESLALYLQPGVAVDDARERFARAAGSGIYLQMSANHELRRRVLVVFDQTFRITYALQAIAVVVAVLGVITTLTALILQRGREIAVLRAVGALRGQIRKMVLVESALLGLIGGLMGCACGMALSVLLIHVINRQFFGWTIRMNIEAWTFIQAVLVMIATAMLAGLAPARLAATRPAAEAMRVE